MLGIDYVPVILELRRAIDEGLDANLQRKARLVNEMGELFVGTHAWDTGGTVLASNANSLQPAHKAIRH